MTDLIYAARLAFVQARANGVADETTAAALADGMLANANPLELRRALLQGQLGDLAGLAAWARGQRLYSAAREYDHQISRISEQLDTMAANVAAE